MDAGARNRARLYLRSERALGLSVVPRPPGVMIEDLPHEPEPAPQPVVARSRPAGENPPRPQPTQRPQTAPSSPFQGVSKPNEMVPAGGLVAPVWDQPFTAPVLPADEKRRRLVAMDQNEVRGCTRCRLCETRTQTVFGEGDADAQIFFIGEGPGENEDQTGRPFVGRAGQLLDKMIQAMGLAREQVFIANIVKCRPPGNRVPAPDEVATCTPYLERQLEIVRPRAIVTLGLPAAQYMLQVKQSMGRLRGQWHAWRGIRLMPTYHPAYILRSYTTQVRAAVWSDLQMVLRELGLPVPHRKNTGD